MNMIPGSRKCRYLVRFGVFVITAALIALMVGCSGVATKYNLIMAVAGGNGTATDLINASPYEAGTQIIIIAKHAAYYQFVKWTAPAGTFADANEAGTIFTMPAREVTVTANFAYSEPTLIRTWYDLDAIRNDLSGCYIIMNDLDSTILGYEQLAGNTVNDGKGWQPIGFVSPGNDGFTGTLDGQGYEIHDLFINRSDDKYIGLFGEVSVSGIVQNIGVVNTTVTGYDDVGILVGWNGGTVSNSYSTGIVTGKYYVGGLVGANSGIVNRSYSTGSVTGTNDVGGLVGWTIGTVSNSYSAGNVTGYSCVGGLVGWNDNTVSNSYSTGIVTGSSRVGGLVGYNCWGTLSNSYFTGSVTGSEIVGGLVGDNYYSDVSNSYSTGNVTGSEIVGGLVGESHCGDVSNSYSTGNVTGTSHVGGLVGWNYEGSVSNSFWNMETSGQATSDGGTGKSTTEMQDIATFSVAGWNIIAVALNETNPAYIWNIVNNVTYPFLSWQP